MSIKVNNENTWIKYQTWKFGKQNNSINKENKREEIIRIKVEINEVEKRKIAIPLS